MREMFAHGAARRFAIMALQGAHDFGVVVHRHAIIAGKIGMLAEMVEQRRQHMRPHAIDQMCQKCHDQDNDVTWLNNGFERKWPKVDHVTVPQDEEAEKQP